MSNPDELKDLEADLEGKKAAVSRERTNVLLSAELKEKIKTVYPDRSLGSVLEEGAIIKLRKDGHIPEKPAKAEPAQMESYVKAKKVEKVAIDEIKDRVEKSAPKKPQR
jgi:hypothetical protein